MDKSYHHHHFGHHHPLSFITTRTPYHLNYYGPSSFVQSGGGSGNGSRPGEGGGGGSAPPVPKRNSANSSNTSSPLSSNCHRAPLYRTYTSPLHPHHHLSPNYIPYNQNSSYFSINRPLHHHLKDYNHHRHGDRIGINNSNTNIVNRNYTISKLQHLSNRLHSWKSVSIVSHETNLECGHFCN